MGQNHLRLMPSLVTRVPTNDSPLSQNESHPPISSDDTANTKAGIAGLWKEGRKVNCLAISWKRLVEYQSYGIGVNEVEADAWRRQANRAARKGINRRLLEKGSYSKDCPWDKRYIEREMHERIRQAREDWGQARSLFLKNKASVLREAKNQ